MKRMHAHLLSRLGSVYEPLVADRKRALFESLRGEVLEIGPGTGPNLAFYSPGVRWIGVEPNPYMHTYLRDAAKALRRKVEIRPGTAERLPADSASADAVVGTLVLCSVRDPELALQEILRVLKPGERFVFVEHVSAPVGTRTRRERVLPHHRRPLRHRRLEDLEIRAAILDQTALALPVLLDADEIFEGVAESAA